MREVLKHSVQLHTVIYHELYLYQICVSVTRGVKDKETVCNIGYLVHAE